MILTDEAKLRVQCVDVLPEEVNDLKLKLDAELKESAARGFPGVGLAAPQIGIAKNMAIVRIGHIKIDLVNCKIKKYFDEFIFDNEGCLSFPNKFVKTKRFKQVYVVNNMVEPYNFLATDLAAVVIQHELDHANGLLLPDFALDY